MLVNSAGTIRFMTTEDMDRLDAADFKRAFAVNVLDIFHMSHHRVAGEFGDGAIVVRHKPRNDAYSGASHDSGSYVPILQHHRHTRSSSREDASETTRTRRLSG